MKNSIRISCVILLFTMILSCIGCTVKPNAAIEKRVLDYLTDKYGSDLQFTLDGYTQNTGTNGRYEVSATCTNDQTEFQIYIYYIFL